MADATTAFGFGVTGVGGLVVLVVSYLIARGIRSRCLLGGNVISVDVHRASQSEIDAVADDRTRNEFASNQKQKRRQSQHGRRQSQTLTQNPNQSQTQNQPQNQSQNPTPVSVPVPVLPDIVINMDNHYIQNQPDDEEADQYPDEHQQQQQQQQQQHPQQHQQPTSTTLTIRRPQTPVTSTTSPSTLQAPFPSPYHSILKPSKIPVPGLAKQLRNSNPSYSSRVSQSSRTSHTSHTNRTLTPPTSGGLRVRYEEESNTISVTR
jgi:hypothetical protein